RKKDGSFLVTTIERLPDDGRDEGVDLVEDQRLGPNGDGDQQIHLRDDFYLLSSHVRRGGLWEASRSRARVQRHTNLYNRQMMRRLQTRTRFKDGSGDFLALRPQRYRSF